MQNAQVPSATTMDILSNQTSSVDGWYSHFPQKSTTNPAPRANEMIIIPAATLPSNAVFTMPISVKPKTREPVNFTDNRIYVSNIPFSFREQDLASMFYPYGRVLSVEIVTNDRGSKGFGFVTLDSIDSCERARAGLHESHVQGRIIEVRRATPTRRKVPNQQSEVVPPPKLCVDLRAPHSLWRSENAENYNAVSTFVNPNFSTMPPFAAPFHNRFNNDNASQFQHIRTPFAFTSDANVPQRPQQHKPPRCIKHSELKLSSNGDYFLKNGEPTTETSLLMCMQGHNECRSETESNKNDSSDIELTQVFPTHIRDQITALLDTSTHHSSAHNSSHPSRRADSVGSSGVRTTSESEAASDDENQVWTPNSSPDLLASLYEGSTSFHAPN